MSDLPLKTGTAFKSGIVWDLDGTLYENPPTMSQAWLDGFYQAARAHGLDLGRDELDVQTRDGFNRYGNAVRWYGLHHGLDENVFFQTVLSFMDVELIKPCRVTQNFFHQNPSQNMAVLTSAHRQWACPVLRHIGLDHIFPDQRVVAYCDTEGHLKSQSEKPFHMVAERLGQRLEQLIMVEDTPANLVIAKELGMATVLVTHGVPVDVDQPLYVDFVVEKPYDIYALINQGKILWHKNPPENLPC